MGVHLQQDASSATFSKQLLLDNGKEKVPIDAVTKCISFPSNFCTIVPSTEKTNSKWVSTICNEL